MHVRYAYSSSLASQRTKRRARSGWAPKRRSFSRSCGPVSRVLLCSVSPGTLQSPYHTSGQHIGEICVRERRLYTSLLSYMDARAPRCLAGSLWVWVGVFAVNVLPWRFGGPTSSAYSVVMSMALRGCSSSCVFMQLAFGITLGVAKWLFSRFVECTSHPRSQLASGGSLPRRPRAPH